MQNHDFKPNRLKMPLFIEDLLFFYFCFAKNLLINYIIAKIISLVNKFLV